METQKNHNIILSTAYLPNLQYFSKLLASVAVVLEQHENYLKQTYRNRCEILTANGIMPLIIPVRHSGSKIKIREVKIDYSTSWQKIHWRTITAAYKSSPFFEYYIDDFLPFFEKKETFLFDFNLQLITNLLDLTGLKTEILLSESYMPEYEFDYRTSISPKKNGSNFVSPCYSQVFSQKFGFQQNLSILDLLCNEGNNSYSVLKTIFQHN